MSLSLVRRSHEHLRVGRWRGDGRIAYLAPLPGVPLPPADSVRRTCARLTAEGYRKVITAALDPTEAHGFLTAGFAIREHLHVLVHQLLAIPPQPEMSLRRAHRSDRGRVLTVDERAFSAFWRLDDAGLDEAVTATPTARIRVGVADATRDVVAYAVWGRAGHRGYLQRLAVDPPWQRHGFGSALVVDGLHWVRRRGGHVAVVNTQVENEPALLLYERLGFRRQPGGLVVLQAELDP